MKKGVTICFRTTDETRSALERAARDERRSLSSLVELILTDRLNEAGKSSAHNPREKRRHERKPVVIPANIKIAGRGSESFGAVVHDLSLAGMGVSVPKECVSKIYDREGAHFEAFFVLPENEEPIRVTCKAERVVPSSMEARVGASFIDADFDKYQKLQQYLVEQ